MKQIYQDKNGAIYMISEENTSYDDVKGFKKIDKNQAKLFAAKKKEEAIKLHKELTGENPDPLFLDDYELRALEDDQ